jgi:hypothetical protein
MKYMMLLVRSDEAWESLSDQERDYASINRFWMEQARAGHIQGGAELAASRTATTVRWKDGKPMIFDGPFMEAKETIGGYAILDVPDLDAALAVAKAWPAAGHAVEIRPLVERDAPHE